MHLRRVLLLRAGLALGLGLGLVGLVCLWAWAPLDRPGAVEAPALGMAASAGQAEELGLAAWPAGLGQSLRPSRVTATALVLPKGSVAWIMERAGVLEASVSLDGEQRILAVGGVLAGWTVSAIDASGVDLQQDERSLRLELP